jgi:hypothetical protein
MTIEDGVEFAAAWARVEELIPMQHRKNKYTQADELVQEVAVVFRRKTGQWWVTVGSTNAAKPTPVAALSEVADKLERREVDRKRRDVGGWGR